MKGVGAWRNRCVYYVGHSLGGIEVSACQSPEQISVGNALLDMPDILDIPALEALEPSAGLGTPTQGPATAGEL